MLKSKVLALLCLGSNLGSATYQMCHYYLSASLMSGISLYLSILHREGLWVTSHFWLLQIKLLSKSWHMSWWSHGCLFVRYKPRNMCLPYGRRLFSFVDTAMHFLKDILSAYTPPESSSRSTSLPTLGMVSVGFIIALKSCCYGRLQQREPLQQMLPVLTSHCPGEMRVRKLTLRVSQASGKREAQPAGNECLGKLQVQLEMNKLHHCPVHLTYEFG